MEMRPDDPFFAAGPQPLHEAIKMKHEVDPSVDAQLFEQFFRSEEYINWVEGTKPWQLHCFGPPGCGKTELVAAIAQRLRRSHKSREVLTMFICQDVDSHSMSVVEDVLRCIAMQLRMADQHSNYMRASILGQPVSDRIAALGDDITARISGQDYSYVLFDGFDRLSELLQSIIQQTFTKLHVHGLRVLVTRRVPAYAVTRTGTCDDCEEENLNIYWVCPDCQKKEYSAWSWLCYPCQNSSKTCPKCPLPRTNFVEDRRVVNIQLAMTGLEGYVDRNIRCELATISTKRRKAATNFILSQSEDNVALVRLYMETALYEYDLNTDPNKAYDRLPRNVIAYFDTELQDLYQAPTEQRVLSMLTIMLATSTQERSFERLADVLRRHVPPSRSAEDVLRAARGWIVQQSGSRMCSYSLCFSTYVHEDYNEHFAYLKATLLRDAQNKDAEVDRVAITAENLRLSQACVPQEPRPKLDDLPKHNSDTSSISFQRTPSLSLSIDTMSNSSFSRQSSFTSRVQLPNLLNHAFSFSSSTNEGYGRARLASIYDDSAEFMSEIDTLDELTPVYVDHSTKKQQGLETKSSDKASVSDAHARELSTQICRYCYDQIITCGAIKGTHQSNEQLVKSVALSCILCKVLYLQEDSLCRPQFSQRSYTWSIAGSVQARLGERSKTLTFRSKSRHADTTIYRFHFIRPDSLRVGMPLAIGDYTSPKNTGPQIKSWMEACNSSHSHCHRSKDPSWLPTRLIDLGQPESTVFRIVNTKYGRIRGPYCTLSHSWGSSNLFTTTLRNIEKHLFQGFSCDDLPKTFQEAIEVVRLLGVRYVWIDSICIIQDPPGDFITEGALMHAVYRNSYCNIVAADSKGGDSGLFRTRDPHSIIPTRLTVPQSLHGQNNSPLGKPGTDHLIVSDNSWERDLLQNNFIYSRAWVFQERLLAPRLLHFSRNQVYWDCATLSACESFPDGLPLAVEGTAATDRHWRARLALSSTAKLSGAMDHESSFTFWDSVVKSYTSCNLTSQADKNLAIWSIAKVLRDTQQEQGEYAVGMWSKYLIEQLAWRVADTKKSQRLAELQCDTPSWSWTSVCGIILPKSRIEDERIYSVCDHNGNEVQFKIDKTDEDKPPSLRENALAIKGYLQDGRIRQVLSEGRDKWQFESNVAIMEAFPDELRQDDLYKDCKLLLLAASAEGDSEEEEENYENADETESEDYDNETDEHESQKNWESKSETEAAQDAGIDSFHLGESDNLTSDDGHDSSDLVMDERQDNATGDNEVEYTQNSDDVPATAITYHGIGLVLVSVERYNTMQEARLRSLETSHKSRLKKPGDPCCGKWPCDKQKEILGIRRILDKATNQRTQCDRAFPSYRRIGMVKFEDNGEGTYSALKKGGPTKLYLE